MKKLILILGMLILTLTTYAQKKISEYPRKTTLSDSALMDVSDTLGGGTWKTYTIQWYYLRNLLDTVPTSNIVYVDKTMTNTDTTGAFNKPFHSITGALNSISGNTSTNPYYIYVMGGVYNEDVTIKNYVYIVGTNFFSSFDGGRINGKVINNGFTSGIRNMYLGNFDTDTSLWSNGVLELNNCYIYGTDTAIYQDGGTLYLRGCMTTAATSRLSATGGAVIYMIGSYYDANIYIDASSDIRYTYSYMATMSGAGLQNSTNYSRWSYYDSTVVHALQVDDVQEAIDSLALQIGTGVGFDSTHCWTKILADTIEGCSPLVLNSGDTTIVDNLKMPLRHRSCMLYVDSNTLALKTDSLFFYDEEDGRLRFGSPTFDEGAKATFFLRNGKAFSSGETVFVMETNNEVRDEQGDCSEIRLNRGLGTHDVPVAITEGYYLGELDFCGYDGERYRSSARISAKSEFDFDPTHHGAMIDFTTTDTATDNGIIRMQIRSNGNIGIGTTTFYPPVSKLQVAGGVQIADDTASANRSNKVGTMRYRLSNDTAYFQMYMETGTSTYQWKDVASNFTIPLDTNKVFTKLYIDTIESVNSIYINPDGTTELDTLLFNTAPTTTTDTTNNKILVYNSADGKVKKTNWLNLYNDTIPTSNIVYVDKTMNNTDTTGAFNKPFHSITGALNSISGNTNANHYTIVVAPALYTEDVIMKNFVNIVGQFSYSNLSYSAIKGTVYVGNITAMMRNISILNNGGADTSIVCTTPTYFEIDDCYLYGHDGIYAPSGYLYISNTSIYSDNAFAIKTVTDATINLNFCKIEGQVIQASASYIYNYYSATTSATMWEGTITDKGLASRHYYDSTAVSKVLTNNVQDAIDTILVRLPEISVVSDTLEVADWVADTLTLSVPGVTANSIVTVSPMGRANGELWIEYEIYAEEQDNDELKFSCVGIPAEDIYIKIEIINY